MIVGTHSSKELGVLFAAFCFSGFLCLLLKCRVRLERWKLFPPCTKFCDVYLDKSYFDQPLGTKFAFLFLGIRSISRSVSLSGLLSVEGWTIFQINSFVQTWPDKWQNGGMKDRPWWSQRICVEPSRPRFLNGPNVFLAFCQKTVRPFYFLCV